MTESILNNKYSHRAVKTIFVLWFFGNVIFTGWYSATNEQHNALLWWALLVAFLPMLALVFRKKVDLFHPYLFLFALLYIGLFLKSVYMVDNQLDDLTLLIAHYSIDIVYFGVLLMGLSTVAYMLGFSLAPPMRGLKSWSSRPLAFNSRSYFVVFFGLLLIAAISTLVFMVNVSFFEELAAGRFSVKRRIFTDDGVQITSSGYLRLGAQMFQVAVLLYLARRLSQKPKFSLFSTLWLLSLVFMAVWVPLISSTRTDMFVFIVIVLAVLFYHRGGMSLITLSLIGALFIAVFTVGASVRESGYGKEGELQRAGFVQYTLSKLVGLPNLWGVGKVSVIGERFPDDFDYFYGASLLSVFVAPIPRSAWADKPVIRLGPFVGQEVYEMENDSGIPASFTGELYMNFGTVGVLLGFLVLGWITGGIYRSTIYRRSAIQGKIFYSVFIVISAFSLLSSELTVFIIEFLKVMLPFSLALRFSTRKMDRRAYQAPGQGVNADVGLAS